MTYTDIVAGMARVAAEARARREERLAGLDLAAIDEGIRIEAEWESMVYAAEEVE